MIRVTGIIKSPIDEPIEYTSLLLQTINGSLEVLPNSYAHIELDETGEYDFHVLNGSYRVYANYENSMRVHVLGEFTASNGMNDPSYTLNQLVSNFSPQAPDWAVDLDNKWQDLFDDLIEEANTRFSTINQAITDGDAQVIFDMTTLVNEELQAQAAIFTEQVSAGNAHVLNQAKAYTDAAGNEIANNITQVSNSVSTVSQQLTAYKDETDNSISAITSRIDTNEANLVSEISAEVNAQTGEMELRIENSIGTEVANISDQISIVQDDLNNQKAAWQVVATVDELTSSIGMTNDGTNSIIYLQAESLILTNDNSGIGNQTAPFVVEGGVVYMNNAIIKELKGDNISTTATIITGSGNVQAGMNGLDEGIYNGWRFWAGNALPALAPFRVNRFGKLFATDADIKGAIEATSGSFTGSIYANQGTLHNVTIKENCTIKGNLEGATGSFSGTVRAENIIGDLVAAKAVPLSRNEIANSWTTIGSFSGINNTGHIASLFVGGATLSLRCKVYPRGNGSATGSVRVIVNGRVVSECLTSATARSTSDSDEASEIKSFAGVGAVVSLPIGQSFSVSIQVRSDAINSRASIWANTDAVAQLFRNGSAFN